MEFSLPETKTKMSKKQGSKSKSNSENSESVDLHHPTTPPKPLDEIQPSDVNKNLSPESNDQDCSQINKRSSSVELNEEIYEKPSNQNSTNKNVLTEESKELHELEKLKEKEICDTLKPQQPGTSKSFGLTLDISDSAETVESSSEEEESESESEDESESESTEEEETDDEGSTISDDSKVTVSDSSYTTVSTGENESTTDSEVSSDSWEELSSSSIDEYLTDECNNLILAKRKLGHKLNIIQAKNNSLRQHRTEILESGRTGKPGTIRPTFWTRFGRVLGRLFTRQRELPAKKVAEGLKKTPKVIGVRGRNRVMDSSLLKKEAHMSANIIFQNHANLFPDEFGNLSKKTRPGQSFTWKNFRIYLTIKWRRMKRFFSKKETKPKLECTGTFIQVSSNPSL